MFPTEYSTEDVDLGSSREDFPMLALSQTNGEQELNVATGDAHTIPRAFCYSPQYIYRPSFEDGANPRHRNSEPEFVPNGRGGFQEHRASQQLDHLDHTAMFFTPQRRASESMDQRAHAQLYGTSDTTPSGAQFAFSPGPRSFSTQSSPGYLHHELPDVSYHPPAHAHAGHLSSDYPYPQRHGDLGMILDRPSSYHGSPMLNSPLNTWDTQPAQSTSYPMPSPPRPPSLSAVFNAFGHHPPAGARRRVPQMFKLAPGRKRLAGKKQPMACLFCRERKIGCQRPAETDPDQTCNQCARRERRCEYPTESRRGQHNRIRFIEKKIGVQELTQPGELHVPDSVTSSADGLNREVSR
ncbi:hypothetical protein B0H14DRAFT_3725073 [Mycena olivaceomarginata]|nr:hypothetical protein B0H14DRAFT_3725073 [Mycena olivaceomarginata]